MVDNYHEEIVDPGDRASAFAKRVCQASWENSNAVEVIADDTESFRGFVGFVWPEHVLRDMLKRKTIMIKENDGAGGKLQLHALVGDTDVMGGAGWEVIVMTADDVARRGGLPVVMDNELNAKLITDENYLLYQAAMDGYGAALKRSRIINITGEIAIMKYSITAFCDDGSRELLVLTWGGSCLGLARRDAIINGSAIKPGMFVVGFEEDGYRCNGGTFFVNLIMEKFGKNPGEIRQNPEAMEFIRKLAVPSVSYARTISRLHGWNEDGSYGEPLARLCGVAHITGGGVWGKFGEILPPEVGAVLDSMPDPSKVLLEAQQMAFGTKHEISDFDCYGTLHGGCGKLLVVPDSGDADIVIKEAAKDGIRASVVGQTVNPGFSSKVKPVWINSRFSNQGKVLHPRGL